MKRTLLFMGAIALCLGSVAQTEIYSNDFESYAPGDGIAEVSDDFLTWNSGDTSTEGIISDAYASSGSNSCEISFALGTDVVYAPGPYTSGKYDVRFNMLIPSGQEGYLNAMHAWDYNSTTGYEWACDLYFSATGDMTWTIGGADGGAASFDHDTWFEIQITADLDNDLGYIYLNGDQVVSWQWSLNNADGTAGQNQLAAVDFFGWGPSGNTGQYFIDDLVLEESTGVSVEDQKPINVWNVYPNPATEVIYLQGIEAGSQVSLISLDGRIVEQFGANNSSAILPMDVSAFNAGIYFVEVVKGNDIETKRIVVRR